ncbi:MAG: enoyl-CoA hydratase-related protein [Bacteroidota bacterium]
MDHLLYEFDQGVATITLNRPDVYNSFNQDMALALQKTLDECAKDETVRAICLTGAGKAFCAGQDLQEIIDPNGPGVGDIVGNHYNPIIKRLREIEKPIIAAINGVAAGAGANIALACDITIAKESASFIQAFSKIGLIPDSGGTYFLTRLVGFQRASALMMLGDKVSATDAVQMGMIYKAVAEEDFEATVKKIAQKLAKMPTKGLGLTKRALNLGMNNDLDRQLAVEEQLQTAASQTADYKEGVNAFLEKRQPTFTGQ